MYFIPLNLKNGKLRSRDDQQFAQVTQANEGQGQSFA